MLLVETIFDTLNAKAAIAAREEMSRPSCPSGSPSRSSTGAAGRSSGQTIEAFWTCVAHADPVLRRRQLLARRRARCGPTIEELARIGRAPVSCYPNAGLPNAFGGYDEDAGDHEPPAREFAESGFVNIVGGCCGTTPEHIRADRRGGARRRPARAPRRRRALHAVRRPRAVPRSRPDTSFVMIGERTNVTGSAKFAG